MAMNRRLVLKGKSKPMTTELKPIPTPPPKGIVIKTRFAGICHSDVHIFNQSLSPIFVYPRVLGHEIAGVVHSVGDGHIDGQIFRKGDRVAIYPWGGCRKCDVCKAGSQHCMSRGSRDSHNYGIVADGGFQEYVVVNDRSQCIKVPDGLSLDTACLLPCSGVSAFNAIRQLEDTITEAVRIKNKAVIGIVGAGGLGLWGIKLLKVLHPKDVTICVFDQSEAKLAVAKQAGADITLNWEEGNGTVDSVAAQVKTTCGGFLDGAIDFVGAPTTFHRIHLSLKFNATIVLVGLHGGQVPPIELRHIVGRNLRIQGAFVGSQNQANELFVLVAENQIKPPPLTIVGIDDVNTVIENLEKGRQKGRALVKFS